MKLSEAIDLRGRLRIRMYNRANQLLNETAADNSIVLTGRDLVARLFLHLDTNPVGHVAVGTGSNPVDAVNDTQLQTELFRKPIDPVVLGDLTTTDQNKKKATITAELDFTEANGVLTEAGLFNAEEAGVMYNRVVFAPVTKTSDFKLTLIWDILF